jgi:hypothetical protein
LAIEVERLLILRHPGQGACHLACHATSTASRSYSISLKRTLAQDDRPDMSAPRAALLKRLEEVATKDWLDVLRESTKQ